MQLDAPKGEVQMQFEEIPMVAGFFSRIYGDKPLKRHFNVSCKRGSASAFSSI